MRLLLFAIALLFFIPLCSTAQDTTKTIPKRSYTAQALPQNEEAS